MTYAGALTDELAASARRVVLDVGDVLVREGDVADDVFLVVSGSMEALNRSPGGEVIVGSISAGQVVGEVTVIAGGRRTASLRATETTEVLVIARADFEQWLVANPEIADSVSAQARERIDRTQVAAMVAQLAGDSDPDLVQLVLDRVSWRRLDVGEKLFDQGDPSDEAYFIVSGRLMVLAIDDDGRAEPVAELGRGEVVGELGLLDDAPRSATVRAVRDTTVAVFPTRVFEELVTASPAMMLHVTRGILTRLRRTPRRKRGRAASLAVVVTVPGGAPGLVARVADEIGRFGSVRHLWSARIDELLSRPGISQASADNVGVPRLAEFMHEADVGNDHVILETDAGLSGWTRRAIHQADRVVIVASPQPSVDERATIRATLDELGDDSYASTMLAVMHPAATSRPIDTAALLAEFAVDDVVHLRRERGDDVARLARLASGNGVGLVLSGGGGRGFAHLGVYRSLVELGVPVDAVAGCSIGAPLAACIAQQVPLDEMVSLTQRQFHRLLDYTLPVVSLVKGERITARIDETLGGWDIEDLWLPFYCVSTNLTRSSLEVHRRGGVARAVRASVAIPGILPPVPLGDELLVDGGVLNNLPFQVMSDDGTISTLIAVDVAPRRGPRAKSDYGLSVSGFRALAESIRGSSSYPRVSAVLMRSMLAGAVQNQIAAMDAADIDLVLTLDLPGVSLLDFERVAEVAQAGYDTSIGSIREWASSVPWLATGVDGNARS